jgi:Asp-tRNA(Asn)/Glu-tRNA(Gln) amidotransferase A subunit family amidase
MIDLPNTLTQYHLALKSKRLDPKAALRLQRDSFQKLAKSNHCVVDFYDTQPLANKPYFGAALAHKDIFEQDQRSPGVGLRRGKQNKRSVQAVSLQRLRNEGFADLGALSLAPNACSSVAQAIPTATHKNQICINPLNPNWVVGGSSSGSAVAVTSGAIYGSLGTDTAGSVRIPAFTCGIIGLKPTNSLIIKKGVVALCPSLDITGILTRSARDVDVLLEVIASRNRLVEAHSKPELYRVKAWMPKTNTVDHINQLDEHIAQILHQFHKNLGHTIKEGALDWEACATQLQSVMMNDEVEQTHFKSIINGQANPAVRELGLLGLVQPIEWYAYAQAIRSDYLKRFVHSHFQDHDILITPAYDYSIPDVEEVTVGSDRFLAHKRLALHRYTSFVNYLGLPALVMPIAKDASGKPVSIQLIGKPFNERILIMYAAHIEKLIFGNNGILPTYFLSGNTQHE